MLGSDVGHEVPYVAFLGCCDEDSDEPANETLNYSVSSYVLDSVV